MGRAGLLLNLMGVAFDTALDRYLAEPAQRDLAELYVETVAAARELLA